MNPTRVRPRVLAPIAALAVVAVGLAGCGGTGSNAASTTNLKPQSSSVKAAAAKTHPTCPLTGTAPRKGQDRKRPALAVKIDNVAPAMPQAGVNSADVVFEELVEGGLTRLMAVFQCSSPTSIGPIRSARTSDADILALLHGSVFGFSGANPQALPPITAHGDTVQISQDVEGEDFHRDLSRPAPHNVFASAAGLLKAGVAKRKNLKAPRPLFSYGALAPHAKTAHSVALTWPDTTATWTWSKGHWLRQQDGAVDREASGQQLSAANVVVLSVTIGSTGLHDVLGNASPLDITTGSHHRVWVFRDGKVVSGTWQRKKVTSPLHLTTKGGKTIQLTPGRTWVELLPTTSKQPEIR